MGDIVLDLRRKVNWRLSECCSIHLKGTIRIHIVFSEHLATSVKRKKA